LVVMTGRLTKKSGLALIFTPPRTETIDEIVKLILDKGFGVEMETEYADGVRGIAFRRKRPDGGA